jgi:hypothetical protein
VRDIIINLPGHDEVISAVGDNQKWRGLLVPIRLFANSLEIGLCLLLGVTVAFLSEALPGCPIFFSNVSYKFCLWRGEIGK